MYSGTESISRLRQALNSAMPAHTRRQAAIARSSSPGRAAFTCLYPFPGRSRRSVPRYASRQRRKVRPFVNAVPREAPAPESPGSPAIENGE